MVKLFNISTNQLSLTLFFSDEYSSSANDIVPLQQNRFDISDEKTFHNKNE
jgi:hypothetical protein